MAELAHRLVDWYNYVMKTKSDPRTADWLFLGSPVSLVTILVTYIYFCTKLGPTYMRDRKPYQLKTVIFFYNIGQVLFSIYLIIQGSRGGWFNGYSFRCQPVDWSTSPKAIIMANAVWWYFFAKLTELLDTVFFVLRKKNNQITFLHLYHHSIMPVCAWIGAKFLPGGHGTLLGFINCFIHVMMYTYYLLASLGPEYQKYLWWKKYLTLLQMIQFCIIAVHNLQLFFIPCDYPKVIVFLLGTQALVFLYLFASFYQRAYRKSRQVQLEKEILKANGVEMNGAKTNGVKTNGVANGSVKKYS